MSEPVGPRTGAITRAEAEGRLRNRVLAFVREFQQTFKPPAYPKWRTLPSGEIIVPSVKELDAYVLDVAAAAFHAAIRTVLDQAFRPPDRESR